MHYFHEKRPTLYAPWKLKHFKLKIFGNPSFTYKWSLVGRITITHIHQLMYLFCCTIDGLMIGPWRPDVLLCPVSGKAHSSGQWMVIAHMPSFAFITFTCAIALDYIANPLANSPKSCCQLCITMQLQIHFWLQVFYASFYVTMK